LEAQAAGLRCLLSDTITEEARVVDELVSYLPIKKGTGPWVKEIISCIKNPQNRRDTSGDIKSKGYDIKCVSKWYENFYLGLIN
jgi:hypothetical protein